MIYTDSVYWGELYQDLKASNCVIGLDTETTALDPLEGQLRLVQLAVGKRVYIWDLFHTTTEQLNLLRWVLTNPRILKICHNAKFDCKWLLRHLGIEVCTLFDTMLASLLCAAGDVRVAHGLDDLAFERLNVLLDKSQRASDWSSTLTTAQLQYAAQDARVLLPLYAHLTTELTDKRLNETAQIEFDCVLPVAQMELTGFQLDKPAWAELLERKKASRETLRAELTAEMLPGIDWPTPIKRPKRPLKPKLKKRDPAYVETMTAYESAMTEWRALPTEVHGVINLGSHPQMKRALTNLTGLDWYLLTTRDHVLALYADEHPIVKRVQDYRGADKSVTSYGAGWIDACYPDSRIRADFKLIGAETGRMACGGQTGRPATNLQQVPHDEPHRRCFRAAEGKQLIISDFSQIELRIAAHYSQDTVMIAAFQSGRDLHRYTASLVFGVPMDQVTKEMRTLAKNLNFGVIYGIGAEKFSGMSGIPIGEARGIIRRYFQTYRKLDSWLRMLGRQAIEKGYTRTGSGRLITLTADDIGLLERNGRNGPVQGTSADITKIALRLVYETLRGTGAEIVNVIHDEIVVEANEQLAPSLVPSIEDAMCIAGKRYITRVPITVESVINERWVK